MCVCVCITFGVMVLNTVGPTETLPEIGLLTLETYASATSAVNTADLKNINEFHTLKTDKSCSDHCMWAVWVYATIRWFSSRTFQFEPSAVRLKSGDG